jgi:serine/threonine protein kinase
MTKAKLDHLLGKTVGDWQLVEFVDAGNSAAVFRGIKDSQIAAVKVFDPSLVEEFGRERQLNRIGRELTLRGHDHPNLVKIFDGGECKTTGRLYVVMEFIDAPDLASVIAQVPPDRIRPIIAQVAAAARYLEEKDIVHRDIKPDNIAVDAEFLKATLLDLGVMRPLDVSKLAESSDGSRQNFLGTLRYSPPEYIFRTEKQDPDGYRAITFYQLGAVLYDLITRERLFEAFSLPKARLVKAVEQETPKINQPDVSQELVLLAENCLLKDPERRLSFVAWEDFEEPGMVEPSFAARERVRRRFGSSLEYAMEDSKSEKRDWAVAQSLNVLQHGIATTLKDICAGEKSIPRSTTRELPGASAKSSTDVQLIFQASPSLRLPETVSILITAKLIDINPDVVEVEVRGAACYEDSAQGLQELCANKASSVFRGVLNQAILSASLQAAVFRAIDFAQTAGADSSEFDLDS